MIFVAIHRHTAESCPADNPGPVEQLNSPEHAKACGVKVVAGYIAPPEHVFYYVLDTEEYSSVAAFFRPMMKIGMTEITPVLATQEAINLVTAPARRGGRRRAQ